MKTKIALVLIVIAPFILIVACTDKDAKRGQNARAVQQELPGPVGRHDQIGPVREDNESGMSEITFSLTLNPNDPKSIRTATMSTADLRAGRLDITNGHCFNIIRRFVSAPGMTEVYYVALKKETLPTIVKTNGVAVSSVSLVTAQKQEVHAPVVSQEEPKTASQTNRQDSVNVTNTPLVLAQASQKLPVQSVQKDMTTESSGPSTFANSSASLSSLAPSRETNRPPAETFPVQSTTLSAKNANSPAMPVPPYFNAAALPPALRMTKVTYSVGLTDYTFQHGTWLGVSQHRRKTTIYVAPSTAALSFKVIAPHTLRVSGINPTNRASWSFDMTLKDRVNPRKLVLQYPDPDSLGYGVAFLREETKNGWTKPPMTLALHPELRTIHESVAKAPTPKPRKIALSPKAASQRATLTHRTM